MKYLSQSGFCARQAWLGSLISMLWVMALGSVGPVSACSGGSSDSVETPTGEGNNPTAVPPGSPAAEGAGVVENVMNSGQDEEFVSTGLQSKLLGDPCTDSEGTLYQDGLVCRAGIVAEIGSDLTGVQCNQGGANPGGIIGEVAVDYATVPAGTWACVPNAASMTGYSWVPFRNTQVELEGIQCGIRRFQEEDINCESTPWMHQGGLPFECRSAGTSAARLNQRPVVCVWQAL